MPKGVSGTRRKVAGCISENLSKEKKMLFSVQQNDDAGQQYAYNARFRGFLIRLKRFDFDEVTNDSQFHRSYCSIFL